VFPLRQAARVVFRLLAVVYLLGAVGAFFAAGVAIFTLNSRATPAGETLTEGSFDQVFGGHLAMGDLLFLVAVLLVMVAFVAGVDGRKRLGAVALLVLAIVQATLAFAGGPTIRALHPVVGLLLLAIAAWLVSPGVWPGARTTGSGAREGLGEGRTPPP
jgi:hypothetical protein